MSDVAVREREDGRFEVEVSGKLYEVFPGRLGAVCAAYALEEKLKREGDATLIVESMR